MSMRVIEIKTICIGWRSYLVLLITVICTKVNQDKALFNSSLVYEQIIKINKWKRMRYEIRYHAKSITFSSHLLNLLNFVELLCFEK